MSKSRRSDVIELTEYQKQQIETMAGLGLPLKMIAPILGINLKTLQRRIDEDEELTVLLEKGKGIATNAVAQTAFQMAISGKWPQMTMFWLKCRANWSETPFEIDTDKTIKLVYDSSKQASS